MLAAVLLVSVGSTILSVGLLLGPLGRRGHGPAAGVGTAVAVAAFTAVIAAAVGVTRAGLLVGAAAVVLACLVWFPLTRRWSGVARAAWGSAVWAGAVYLIFLIVTAARDHLPVVGDVAAGFLALLQLAAYLVSLAYLWEISDVLGATARGRAPASRVAPVVTGSAGWPFVSLHVPAHNEPSEMVIETLHRLLALDYPDYEVWLIDDNTADPDLWRPVEQFCAEHPERLRFAHLEDWPGYKSGALNYALRVTDPQAEIIGVVDADYLVAPEYLKEVAPLFLDDPRLAFVQTPQDYREWRQASYLRRLYYSYEYFFAVSQPSRAVRNAAIFGGTMGLIRRRALTEVGGWDEWCITEDAELSLRLLRAGWSGRHLPLSYGQGVMPLTFDALKRQRFRWCFGGIQILRRHWRSLLAWDRSEDNHLTPAQRWAYLSGGLQWYTDLLGLGFTALLGATILAGAFRFGGVFLRLSGPVLVVVPVLASLGALRAVAVLRRATGAGWRDAAGALGIWTALSLTVAKASVLGLVATEGRFLRTPKTRDGSGLLAAVNAARVESAAAAALAAAAVLAAVSLQGPQRWLLSLLAVVPAVGFAAAPLNAVGALRSELPDQLRRRQRTERLRAWSARPLGHGNRIGLTVGLAALATFALATVLAPGNLPAGVPSVLSQARGGSAAAGPPRPATHPLPTPGAAGHTAGRGPGGGAAGSPPAGPVVSSTRASASPAVTPSPTPTPGAAPPVSPSASATSSATAPTSRPTPSASATAASPSPRPTATPSVTPSHPSPSSSRRAVTPTPSPRTTR